MADFGTEVIRWSPPVVLDVAIYRSMEYLDEVIGEWLQRHTLKEAIEIFDRHNVPAEAIYNHIN